LGFALFVAAAGGSLQTYATVFPELIWTAEPPWSIKKGKNSGSSDYANTGQIRPYFDNRIVLAQFAELPLARHTCKATAS